VAYKAKSHLLC